MIPPSGAVPGAAPGGPWLAARANLALAPGTVVTATVEAVAGEVAWLRLGGARVPVQARVPLAPGQTLRLWVAHTDGPVWLRVLGTTGDAALPAPGSLPGAAAPVAAEPPPGASGLPAVAPLPGAPGPATAEPPPGAATPAAGEPPPAGPLLATAARALMAYRLPLDPVQLHKVTRLLPAFAPAEQEMAASAAAWLLAAGLAPTLDAVRRLLDWAGGRHGALGRTLAALAAALRRAAAEGAAPAGDKSAALAALQELGGALAGWGYRGEGAGPPPPLAHLFDQAAAGLAQVPPGEARQQAEAALAEARLILRLLATQPPAGWQIWPLPLHLPGLEGEAWLAWRRQGPDDSPGGQGGQRTGHGQGRPASHRHPDGQPGSGEELHVFVATPHLGLVHVALQETGGAVGATVTAEGEGAAAALAAALPDLAGRLAARGLQVRQLAVQTAPVAVPPILNPPAGPLPARLDVRA